MKQYTRKEVIEIIDNLLQHADAVIDAIQSEDPRYDAEELLEMVEESMAGYQTTDKSEGGVN